MELELQANKKGLTYDMEHNLSSEPLGIDLLIIKKDANEVIENEIGTIYPGTEACKAFGADGKGNCWR